MAADDLELSSATIAALRARHIAFMMDRMTDERAHGDFVRSFDAGYDHVLAQPIKSVLEPKVFIERLRAVLSENSVRGCTNPIAREIHRRVLASLRADTAKLGDYVPEEARKAIDEIVARPDLFNEELVRKIFEDEVIEEIMRDTLHEALVEFNDSVNPFFADWGLPALIKKVMPIGSGTVIKSMTAVRGEFDKRLDPEIRKFLLSFSRKSKSKIADFVITKSGDPKQVALRRSVVAFLYEESLANLTKNVDDDARMEVDAAAEAIILEVLKRDRPRDQLLAELEKLVAEHGDEPIGKWLERIGVTQRPELQALGELLWPFIKLALESPPAKAFYERITWDFYASLEETGAGS